MLKRTILLFIFSIVWIGLMKISFGEVVLEDIRCKILNKEALKVKECRMRHEHGRHGDKEAFMTIEILEKIHNVTLKVKLMKKSNNAFNIYFTKEVIIDGCKFMQLRGSTLINYMFQFLEPYTNINHTCPFENEIIVRNLKIDQTKIKYLPIPEGQYGIYTLWTGNKKLGLDLRFYFDIN